MTWVFSHRGRTESQPDIIDNTLQAFAAARDIGCHGVELDVQRTIDGALVVHHDPDVPGAGFIHQLDRAALPSYLPLLAEALAMCAGMTVNVEIKAVSDASPGWLGTPGTASEFNRGTAVSTAGILAALGWADRAIVSSFDPLILEAVRSTEPRLAVGLLLPWNRDAAEGLRTASRWGWDSVHPFVTQVSPAFLSDAHGAGLQVHVWTVNARSDLEEMVEMGVDAIITDRPAEALRVTRHGPAASGN